LLANTLKELFEGSPMLFEGMVIEPHWDWSATCPVDRLDSGEGTLGQPEGLNGIRLQVEVS